MINNLNYIGIVRIKINNDVYTIHNEGTDYLFKLLAQALAGYNTSSLKPDRLKIYDNNNDEITTVDDLSLIGINYLALESDFREFSGKWAARYLAYFPGYFKKSTINSYSVISSIKFVLANAQDDLAIIISKDSDLIDAIKALESTNQALIEWNLLVTNVVSDSNSTINVTNINDDSSNEVDINESEGE